MDLKQLESTSWILHIEQDIPHTIATPYATPPRRISHENPYGKYLNTLA